MSTVPASDQRSPEQAVFADPFEKLCEAVGRALDEHRRRGRAIVVSEGQGIEELSPGSY